MVRHEYPDGGRQRFRLFLEFSVFQRPGDLGGPFERDHEHRVRSRIQRGPIFRRRPVEERRRETRFPGLRVDVLFEQVHEPRQIFVLGLHKLQIAGKPVHVARGDDPPERVVRHSVHPLRKRPLRAHQLAQRVLQDLRRAEDVQRGHSLRIEIPHPDEAVALRPLENVVLHREVLRVRGRPPNRVQTLVRAAETPEPRQIPVREDRADRVEHDARSVVHEIKPHEAERALADLDRAEPRHGNHLIAHGVVVSSAAVSQLRHRFVGRLAKPDADFHRAGRLAVKGFQVPGVETDPTVDLGAKVEQDRARLARFFRHGEAVLHFRRGSLTKRRGQNQPGILQAGFGFPDDPLRKDELPNTLVRYDPIGKRFRRKTGRDAAVRFDGPINRLRPSGHKEAEKKWESKEKTHGGTPLKRKGRGQRRKRRPQPNKRNERNQA